jgi:hypothetical protein
MANEIEYHLHRARSERDIAYRSADGVVADVHMRLSALHLGQALLLQAVRRSPVGNVVPFHATQAIAQSSALPLPAFELPAVH